MTALAALATFVPIAAAPPKFVNALANPGFENATLAPWKADAKATYFVHAPDGSVTPANGGLSPGLASYAESGKHSFDFGTHFEAMPFSDASMASIESSVTQPLKTKVPSNAVGRAYVSGNSGGYQQVTVTIFYALGAPSTDSHFFGGPGWSTWGFRSAILPNRTITGLRFTVKTIANQDTVLIDDATLQVNPKALLPSAPAHGFPGIGDGFPR